MPSAPASEHREFKAEVLVFDLSARAPASISSRFPLPFFNASLQGLHHDFFYSKHLVPGRSDCRCPNSAP